MKEIRELARLGSLFWLEGSKVQYLCHIEDIDAQVVGPKLQYLGRHREEAVSFLTGVETEAVHLLDHMDVMDQMVWCRRWADLATRAGWPCTGYESWADWVADVEVDIVSTGNGTDRAG